LVLSYHVRYQRENYRRVWVRKGDYERLVELCERRGLLMLDCMSWLVSLAGEDSDKLTVFRGKTRNVWIILNNDTLEYIELSELIAESLCRLGALKDSVCREIMKQRPTSP
jgi:hypothetical protein